MGRGACRGAEVWGGGHAGELRCGKGGMQGTRGVGRGACRGVEVWGGGHAGELRCGKGGMQGS